MSEGRSRKALNAAKKEERARQRMVVAQRGTGRMEIESECERERMTRYGNGVDLARADSRLANLESRSFAPRWL